MLFGITDAKQVKAARLALSNKMNQIADEKIHIRYSSPAGVSPEVLASYSNYYDIWWYFDGKENQYWNPYGIGKPHNHKAVTGRCQINMPTEGLNIRIAGAFARNRKGNLFLLHNGKVGGGKKGISKSKFLDWYTGSTIEVNFDGELEEYFIVAEFEASNFYEQIQFFVNKIYDFKEFTEQLNNKPKSQKSTDNEFLDGESLTRNPYHLPERTILRGANHAMVTNELLKSLRKLGHEANRNRYIDAYIKNENKLTHIFEVKSNLNTQALYTAIGQLKIYGLNHTVVCILVVEENTSTILLQDLKKLDIKYITFNWKKGKPVFLNLMPIT